MQTVLITGGSGLIGKALTNQLLKQGYKVIILTRSASKKKELGNIRYASWDVKKQTIDLFAIQQADYIIHLAGAGVVEKRWTDSYKKEIQESRTASSNLLIEGLKQQPNKVKAIISASAIGWYGADKTPGKYFKETDVAAPDFLGQTCLLWEDSIGAASALNIRVCMLRTGVVLSNAGGALPEFKKSLQFGIAAILGSGNQVISWIHIDDLCRQYIFLMKNNLLKGSFNAVANVPVNNEELMIKLANRLKGKFYLPIHVPAFVLKLMLGGSSIEVLKSATVSNEKIKETGFTFIYPTIDAALDQLTGK